MNISHTKSNLLNNSIHYFSIPVILRKNIGKLVVGINGRYWYIGALESEELIVSTVYTVKVLQVDCHIIGCYQEGS